MYKKIITVVCLIFTTNVFARNLTNPDFVTFDANLDFSNFLKKEPVERMSHLVNMADMINVFYGVKVELGNLRFENVMSIFDAQGAYGQMSIIKDAVRELKAEDATYLKDLTIRAYSSETCVSSNYVKIDNFDMFYPFSVATYFATKSQSNFQGENRPRSKDFDFYGALLGLIMIDPAFLPFRLGRVTRRIINRFLATVKDEEYVINFIDGRMQQESKYFLKSKIRKSAKISGGSCSYEVQSFGHKYNIYSEADMKRSEKSPVNFIEIQDTNSKQGSSKE